MRRKTGQRDDALEELIGERDHLEIQMSLLRDSEPVRDELIKPLRDKIWQLDSLIESRQRTIYGQSS